MSAKLKIGLLLDDYSVPSWVYKMIKEIHNSAHSEIVLVVLKTKEGQKKTPILAKIWKNRGQLLFKLNDSIENLFFKVSPNAFEPKDLSDFLTCSEIKVAPSTTKFSDYILPEDLEKIRSKDIDVFIRIGFRVLRGEILRSAKYGIWSYHHGNQRAYRGTPAGVWEVLENCEETGVTLQILTEELDGGTILYESFSSTDHISINRTKNKSYWKASSFIPRELNRLYELGGERFLAMVKKANEHPNFYSNKLYKTPSNLEIIKGVGLNFWKSFLKRIDRLFHIRQWILLYRFEPSGKLSTVFYKFKRIVPPNDRIWADPFVISKENRHYIFLEEMLYTENKGKIAVMEIDENGDYGLPAVVLEKDYHLSYPFLIEEKGQLYMIPESGITGKTQLFKCTDFPYKWEFVKVLLNNANAADSTILRHEGKFWMFTNIRENQGASIHDELFLFYTDDFLEGEWEPHPQNPIVSDVKFARSAGNLFVHNGNIYRPAQNGSVDYGHSMQIMQIVTLNQEVDQERPVQSILPNWAKDLIGTHTINHVGKLTVIDALIKRRKL